MNFPVSDSLTRMKETFSFLGRDYEFQRSKEQQSNKGVILEYHSQKFKISLIYDLRENFFYFSLIRGVQTLHPNDKDDYNIRPFFRLAQRFCPDIDVKSLQPAPSQYLQALEVNAELVRRLGKEGLLSSDTWW